jgi:hypothetical protein
MDQNTYEEWDEDEDEEGGPSSHAKLPPSGLYRRINCPGSLFPLRSPQRGRTVSASLAYRAYSEESQAYNRRQR